MGSAGPWGFWDALILLLPIIFLVVMVLKPRPMPVARSLWKAANIMFFIKVIYLKASPLEAFACYVSGVLQALIPIFIVSGAITLLDCMESSQCLAWMKVQLRNITNCHPVAEVMLIGFCFTVMCEGVGIWPVVLTPPMLYSMGHPKFECVACILLFNTFTAIFGAAGIPVWFGVGKAVPEYAEANLLDVGFNAALAMAVCAHAMVPYTVRIVVPWDELRPSFLFVHLSTCSVTLPFVVLSWFSYEFPSAAAGLIGISATAGLTLFGVGLGAHNRGDGLGSFDEAQQDVENHFYSSDNSKAGEEVSPGIKSVKIDDKQQKVQDEIVECQHQSENDRETAAVPARKSVTFNADISEVRPVAFTNNSENASGQPQGVALRRPTNVSDLVLDQNTSEQARVISKDDEEAPGPTPTTATPHSTRSACRSSSSVSFSPATRRLKDVEGQDKEEEEVMRAIESVTFDVDTFEVKSVIYETGEEQTDLGNVDLDTLIRARTFTSLDEAEAMHRPGSTKANVGRATFRSFSNISQGQGKYQSSSSRARGRVSHRSAYSRASTREGGFSRKGSMASLKSRAVNVDVQLNKKDIKTLTKRDSIHVPPAELMRCLDDDDDAPAAVRLQIGDEEAEEHNVVPTVSEVLLRTVPLWLTFLLLLLTRIEPIGLKDILREDTPRLVDGNLGSLGHLSISTAGRISLSKIAGTTLSWTFELLYTPAILPFYVAGWATLLVFRKELSTPPVQLMSGVFHRLRGPAVALSGALVLVELMRTGDDDPSGKSAPAVIIGMRLADALADGWLVLSFPLGALGSFFSGSTTISMLTFSQVQKVAADSLGLSSEALIALQLCGATAGSCCCLANIISAKAVIGLHVSEGVFVKRLLFPVLAMYIICTAVLLAFVYT